MIVHFGSKFEEFFSELNIKYKTILHNASENKKKKSSNKPQKSLKVRKYPLSLLKLKSLRYPFVSLSIKLIKLFDYTIINFEKQIKISRNAEIYLHFTHHKKSLFTVLAATLAFTMALRLFGVDGEVEINQR